MTTSRKSSSNWLINALSFSPEYRELLMDFSLNGESFSGKWKAQTLGLLREYPSLVTPDPYPERLTRKSGIGRLICGLARERIRIIEETLDAPAPKSHRVPSPEEAGAANT